MAPWPCLIAWLCCCAVGPTPSASEPPLPSLEPPSASQPSSAAKSRKKVARSTAKTPQKPGGKPLRTQQPIFDDNINTPITNKPADPSAATLQQNHVDAMLPDLQQGEASSPQGQNAIAQAQLQATTGLSALEHQVPNPDQPATVQKDTSRLPASVGLSDQGLEGPSHRSTTPEPASPSATKPAANAASPMPTAPAANVAGPFEDAAPVVLAKATDETAASTSPLASQTASRHPPALEFSDGLLQQQQQHQQGVHKHAVHIPVQDASSDSDAESDASSQADSPEPDAAQQLTAAMWSIFGQQPPVPADGDRGTALTRAHPAAALHPPNAATASSHGQGTYPLNCLYQFLYQFFAQKAARWISWGMACTSS